MDNKDYKDYMKNLLGEDFDPEDYGIDPDSLPDMDGFEMPGFQGFDLSSMMGGMLGMDSGDRGMPDLSRFMPSREDVEDMYRQMMQNVYSAAFGGEADEDILRAAFEDTDEDYEIYKKNPRPKDLTPRQLAAINIGALPSGQDEYYIDSLETGRDPEEIRENLTAYEIYDRQSALDTMQYFIEGGDRVTFNVVKGMFSMPAQPVDLSFLSDDEAGLIEQAISNLGEAADLLTLDEFIRGRADYPHKDILAWDMARMVCVARGCADAGYLSREEAWEYIYAAYDRSKEVYTSWKDFIIGYVIGAAMWLGADETLPGIIYLAEELVLSEESPWNEVRF